MNETILSEVQDYADLDKKKVYVIDTSVLLSDPNAIFKFEEHVVVIPLVVVTELEKKRVDHELGYFARRALRNLETMREANGGLGGILELDHGGKLLIDVDTNDNYLPVGLKNGSNDSYILSTALKYAELVDKVVVVSKDMPMRILASVAELESEEYRAEIKSRDYWSGFETKEIETADLGLLFKNDEVVIIEEEEPSINTGFVLKSGTSASLAVYVGDNTYLRVDGDVEVFGVQGTSAEQRIAISHLLSTDVGIVSIGGRAGTGKSAIALLAGLEAVLENSLYKKITVFRPMYAVGGQDLGYLPGSHEDKVDPWTQAVYDTLEPLVSENVMDEVRERGLIEVLPLTHIRGRSLHNSYIIVDEAQSLERNVLLTVLSRVGRGSKVVLTHDVAQRDNLRVGRFDGVVSVIEALRGNPLFAHITLRKSERSDIADLVTKLLDF